MTRRWRPARTGLFLAVAWLAGAVVISFILFVETSGSGAAPYVWSVWALLFLSVSYFVACLALNSTTVCVEGGKLIVHTGPVPDFGNSKTDVSDIEEVFTSPLMTSGARGPGGYAYVVRARTKAGKSVPIFTNAFIPDQAEAEALAQHIETQIRLSSSPP